MKKKRKINRENVRSFLEKRIKKGHYLKALDLVKRFKISGVTVTRRTLKENYGLSKNQIARLNFIEAPNPHYATSSPMRLYLKGEAEQKFNVQFVKRD